MEIGRGKLTLTNNLDVAELTIDCEDPQFEKNANCLTYAYGDGDTYKSTDTEGTTALIIIGSILIAILLIWALYTLM